MLIFVVWKMRGCVWGVDLAEDATEIILHALDDNVKERVSGVKETTVSA